MKARILTFTGSIFVALCALAQPDPTGNLPVGPGDIGPHYRVWRSVSTGPGGKSVTNSYTELATGMNFVNPDTGTYESSQERFEITKDGHAVARYGQHQLILAGDINTGGSVDVLTPDGQRIISNPMGLSFHDLASGKNVLLAEVTNCIGELVASNVVLFPNAFDTVQAGIRYTYTRAGYSQDIVLFENVGSPSEWGLDPATTVLEIHTELFSFPAPAVDLTSDNDQTLTFGQLQMARGSAYVLDENLKEIPVKKEFVQIGARHFVIEGVPYLEIKTMLERLQAGISKEKKNRMALRAVPDRESLFALEGMKPKKKAKEVASITPGRLLPRKGVVLDYTTINTSQTNMVFTSGSTYYLSGPVGLYGTTTVFQAACVLKYAPTNSAKLTVNTPITWQGQPYRPIILTGRDDRSVGEFVGTSPLSGLYADTALEINASGPVTLPYLRIADARKGIVLSGSSGHVISHAQFVGCETGIKPSNTDFSLRNALFSGVLTNFNGSSATGRCEHVTVNGGSWLNYNSAVTMYFTNSLLVAVTNWGTLAVTNSTAILSSSSGVFHSVGAGYHYLPTNSTNRNAGTSLINPGLLLDLQSKTTEAPGAWTNLLTTNTTFSPQVHRDDDALDRGWHYDPIDYAVGFLTVSNAVLNVIVTNTSAGITNSTTIANYGPYAGGIWLRGEGSICAEGTPNFPVRFTRFVAVQEQPYEWGGSLTNTTTVMHISPQTSASLGLRFVRMDQFPIPVTFFSTYLGADQWRFNSLLIRDSELFLGQFYLSGPGVAPTPNATLVNNLFENSYTYLESLFGELRIDAYNNLLHLNQHDFWRGGTNIWTAKDNVFDNCTINDWVLPLVNDYNAYINTTSTLQSPGSHSITNLTSFTYGTGPLGSYYQVSTNLLDKGSRTAAAAILSDYTVLTNQVKEGTGTNLIDIGYHYVALTNGVPFDSNANGIPDYIEDRSTKCYCELSCSAPSVTLTNPVNGQVFVTTPTNIVMDAVASDTDGGSILHVDFFNGSTKLGTVSSAPYHFVWQNVGAGTYTLSAQAVDNHLLATNSAAVTITNNAMPTVQVTNPINGQTFTAPISIALKATASDSDGSISSVQFFQGTNTTAIGNGSWTGSNYVYTWSSVGPGSYSVYAKATDNRGAVRLSGLVDFTVNSTNDYPLVSINSPSNGASFKAWSDLAITAGASDASGLSNVDFYAGTNFLGSDSTPASGTNYTITVRGWKPGQYTLTAKATDKSNPPGRNLSAPVTITVQNPDPKPLNGSWDAVFGLVPYTTYGGAVQYDPAGVLWVGGGYGFASGGSPQMLSRGTNCGWTLPFGLSEGDITRRVNSIVSYGTNLFIGGSQADFGGLGNVFSAKWDGSNLVEIGDGLDFTDSPICAAGYETEPGVQAVYVFNGDVYIGGDFTGTATLTQGGVNTNIQHVAKLAGASTNWSAVGTSKLNGRVSAIADLNNTLYVGGDFTAAGTNTAVRYLARLVNGDWQPVGPGVNGPVRALTAHNGRLFVGGEFTTAGGFTNANCIASWNGTAWTTINSGISDGTQDDPGNSCSAATRVEGIAARGSEIYICGDFTKAWNGDSAVSSRYVARAIWNETDQIWQWSGLAEGLRFDDGTGADDPSINGRAITIREFGNGTGYDVVVVGVFSEAGGLPANNAARWVVGQSECATTGPAVTVTSPTSGAKVSGTNFTFSGTAQSTGYTITQVEVFLNGGFLGTGNLDTSTNWSFVYTNLSPGPCTVKAVATDSNDKSAASAPITFTCVRTTGPTANADTFHVFSTGAATNLNVLANDVLTNGTPRIVGVNKWANPFAMMAGVGSVRIAYGATNLVYVANPYTFGTNVVSYDVADNGGTNTGIATVYVHALPRATINAPINGTIFPTNSITTNVIGTAQDFDGSISSVTLFVNGLQYGSPTTNSNFTNSFSTNVAGFYTLLAVATDNDGFTNGSPPVSITIDPPGGIPPFAEITSLLNDTTNFTTLVATNYPVVRDGFLTLIGSAYDPDGDSVTRQLLLFRPGELTQFANVTPGALDYFGFTSGAVTNGNLGTLNLSAIPNGVYDLVLVVRSRGDQSSDSVRFTLDNQLKIGAFSFSEQDLVIPVNGIALTVIRTYDSMNQVYADFGYNWTYALNDLDMVIDENRQTTNALVASGDDPYDGSANLFSLRTGGGRSVTLTLPGGQRTTFAFAPTFRDNFALAQWQSPPGVTATLTMITNNTIDFWGGAGLQNPYFRIAGPETPFEAFDIEGYYLTLKDGTVYELHRDPALGTPQWVSYLDGSGVPWSVSPYSGKPKLTNIRQRSGDTITINNGGIWHSPPGTTNATRTVLFDRDSQNRITAIHDPIGGTYPAVKYVYNQDSGNLIQVLRLLDRSAGSYTTNTYHYDNAAFPHFITEIDNPSGIPITRNQYDAGGRLIASTDANGNKVSYTHDLTNHLETVVDRLGHTNIFGYDTRGNIIANTNALGQVARFAFDDNNNKTNEVNALNQTNNYVFSTNSLLLVSIDPLGQSNSFTYNNFSQLASASDGRNNTTTNYYDSSGNLTAISNVFGLVATNVYSNALMVSSKDALGNITTNQYDQFGNLVNSAVIDTNNVTLTSVSYAYDSNNNRTNQTIIRTIPGGKQTNVTTYIYDGQSRLTQTIEPDGKTNIVVLNLAGQMQATTDKLGRTTSYEYDAVGNLSRVTYPDLTTESYAYDAEGRRAYLTNRLGYVTQYQYDALARLTNTIYPDLSTSTTVFDAAGRVAYIVDARGNTNAFGYDSAGRRTSVTNAYGTAIQMVTTYAYDPAGNQTNMVLVASNLTSSYFYDALNRRTNVTFQDGTKIVTRFDAAGHRIAETDQATNTTQFAYDGLGRLTAVTNALGKVTKYQYDEAGNVTNQVDALNRSTKFEYDTMGRRTKRTLPANQVETFGYDPAGNLLAYTNFNSLILTNQYDVMNRLWKRWNGSTLLETYSYDAVGQLTNRLDTSGNYGWVFDKRGRATTNSTPVATLYYQYDLNGNLTNLNSSTASGVSVGYQYDALNRITNVIDNRLSGTKNTSYTFDGVGNLQSLKYPNGLTNLWQYDSLNRLTNLTWKLNGAQRGDFTYKLGPAGNRTNLVDNVSGTSRTFAWQYDPLYRLTNEVISGGTPTGTLGYVYDDVGNRTSRTGTVGSLSATNNTFDINDWLDNDSTTNNANPYFDANGNQRTNGSNVYLYNYANRLTNANSGAVVIVYGADGNRVKKTTSTTTTIYLVATVNPTGYPQVVEDLTVSGGTTNLSRVYTYGLDLISQRQISGTVVTFYGYDGLGSVRFLTEGTGAITNTYAYDAFGTVIASNTPVANVYLYSGEQWDPDLGLYYLRARLMNPSNGRFLSMDTFEGSNEDPLSLHKYLYTVNPVNTVDPSGRSGLTEVLTVAGIGATLGALTTEAATYAYQGRAATTIEIFQGALYGAGFAVGGWAVPVFGVGVAAYGVGTAAINGYSVLADPNVSWQRKSTAVALFIASAYGTQKAVDYAKVMRGYVPSNPKGASLIPESYMNRIGAVDMRAAPPGSKSNAAGFPLNGAWFFRQLLRQHPEWFSPRNRGLIREGRAPEVDATWVAQFPEHGGYLGSGLRHHHILQGPIAVPVPEPVHVGWSGSLHPAVPNTTVPPGAAGGIAGGLVEETTSDDN